MEIRKCTSCGEEVGFENYWSWTNNRNMDTKYVCTKCMEQAVGTAKLSTWGIRPQTHTKNIFYKTKPTA